MAKDLEAEASKIGWKEFESLAESIFSAYGLETIANYRLSKPRTEIDLIAIKNDIALCIDCKHWKRTIGESTLLKLAHDQVIRARRLLRSFQNINKVIPIILTMHDEHIFMLPNGVPVVPVARLNGFLTEWEGYIRNMLVISRESRTKKKF